MNQDIRFCRSSDGVRIAYALTGSGPPLVMSATWLTHLEHQWRSLAWRPWLEALSGRHTVLRYDSRGCGLSDRDVSDLSFDAWIRDFEAVIEAAGFDRFALLGVCQGGPIALKYVTRHPGRVTHLVLFGTYARGMSQRSGLPAEAEKARILLDLTRLGWGREHHALLQVWASQFQPGGTREHLRSWSEQQREATSAEIAVRLLQIGFDVDLRATAPRVRCPTLVIHAERDAVVPIEEGRLLAGLIPGSRFVQLDSENHMLLPDEPAWTRFLEEVRAFLPQAGAARAACRTDLALTDLTPRERDVLEGIAQGLDNAEIAAALRMSTKTVRNHITRVFDKIGVEHRYQAIVRAREAGLGAGLRLTPR